MDPLVSIQDAARQLGVSVHTLRWYEKIGLLAVGRTTASHRRYSERDIAWLRLLRRLRSTGMPIQLLQRYAALVHEGDHTTEARRALLMEHEHNVVRQIRLLETDLAAIRAKIAGYDRWMATAPKPAPAAATPAAATGERRRA